MTSTITETPMFRVYIGNLDHNVTEETLQTLFQENQLTANNIQLKRGYAFVECPDQVNFDKTIEKLNGYSLLGSTINVEPSTVSKRRKSTRIQIKNLPDDVRKEEITQLVSSKGNVKRCDIVTSKLDTYVTVEYESVEEAQKALDELNNHQCYGNTLQVEFLSGKGNKRSKSATGRKEKGGQRSSEVGVYILRLLVPSEYVGAIIGKKGQTIQTITSECKVLKIDVHGKDSSGFLEKAIFIAGKELNSVSKACKEILKIMHQEASANNRSEAILKLLADDRYCGRVIGKEGKIIKKIREDTNTKIVVSGSEEMVSTYPDRIITIRGSVEDMSKAEAIISGILYKCMEKDLLQRGNMLYNGVHSSRSGYKNNRSYSTPRFNFSMSQGGLFGNSAGGTPGQRSSRQRGKSVSISQPENQKNNYYIIVPNAVVGAIIGTGGMNIKQIIRDSGAYVTIESKKEGDSNPASNRSVNIKGTAEAFWRASYWVFEKMKIEGFAGNDDVRLQSLMSVPKTSVGRIIGKGGKNARDMEQITGAIVRINDDPRAGDDEVMVEVCGTFTAIQGALSRIRTIVNTQYPSKQQARSVSPPRDRGDHRVSSQ